MRRLAGAIQRRQELSGRERQQQAGEPARQRQVVVAAGGEGVPRVATEADQVAQFVEHQRGGGDHRGEPDCRRAGPHLAPEYGNGPPPGVHRQATPRSPNRHEFRARRADTQMR